MLEKIPKITPRIDTDDTPATKIWKDPESVTSTDSRFFMSERVTIDHLKNLISKVNIEKQALMDPGLNIRTEKEADRVIKLLRYFFECQKEADTFNAENLKKSLDIEIQEFRETLFNKMQPIFEEMTKGNDPLSENFLKLLSHFSESLSMEMTTKVHELLLRNLPKTTKNSWSMSMTLSGLAQNTDQVGLNKLLESIHELETQTPEFSTISSAIAMLVARDSESRNLAKVYIRSFLKRNGLPFREIFNAWQDNSRVGSSKDKKTKISLTEAIDGLVGVIGKNILRIHEMEREMNGLVKFLYDNYGIHNYARFSLETWRNQYLEKEKGMPYGLIVVARNDWNSSSYSEQTVKTYDNLQREVHPSHSLKVIEAKSLPELARIVKRTITAEGKAPDFVVWSGHSSGKDFVLGRNLYRKRNYKFHISTDDLEGEALDRMRPYLNLFSEDTTMIFDACMPESVDPELPNLPAAVATKTGGQFIYPKGDTSVKDFGVSRDSNGKLLFNVKYNFDSETKIINRRT